jgi:hypothetical protein
MQGHGCKLPRLKEKSVAAVLTAPTLEDAARQAGVCLNTLKKWLALPEFRDALRQGRQAIYEGAVSRLQAASNEAVDTLRRNLACGNVAVETRAALGVLDQAFRVREQLELEERLAALERATFGGA